MQFWTENALTMYTRAITGGHTNQCTWQQDSPSLSLAEKNKRENNGFYYIHVHIALSELTFIRWSTWPSTDRAKDESDECLPLSLVSILCTWVWALKKAKISVREGHNKVIFIIRTKRNRISHLLILDFNGFHLTVTILAGFCPFEEWIVDECIQYTEKNNTYH